MGRTGQAITAGVDKLARVLLHMEPFDPNRFEIGVFAFLSDFHLNPALLCDRLIELRDLIVLR